MPNKLHHYQVELTWTGNRGEGTSSYEAYGRGFDVQGVTGKLLKGSADPTFLGDNTCWNPEEMLVASVSACHQLWYFHLCATAGVKVLRYVDVPHGVMDEQNGHFVEITLKPSVLISKESDSQLARELHQSAHEKCFIANSLKCPILLEISIGTDAISEGH